MPALLQQSQFSSPLQPLPAFSTDEFVDHEENQIQDSSSVKYDDKERKPVRRSDVSMTRTISPTPESILSGDFNYIPHRNRPPFRTPSSIKALQLSPSPISSPRLPKSGGDRKWSIRAVRRSDILSESESTEATPEAEHDDLNGSVNGHGVSSSPMFRRMMEARRMDDLERHLRDASSPTGTPLSMHAANVDRNSPLVLLHVSVLPIQDPIYPLNVLKAHAPSWVIENVFLLREKLCSAVLARGILIPHPGEEYDVLEERLLEALELCVPRVLGCGHFYDGEGTYDCHDGCNDDRLDALTEAGMDAVPRAICDYAHGDTDSKTGQDDDDDNLCHTCALPVRLPNRGTGHGKRRWDVRFYASNGLMRAGAWSAAWREMERVDVEILPWIPQEIRMALDAAMENEIRAQALEAAERQRATEAVKVEIEERVRQLETQLQRSKEEMVLLQTATSKTAPGSKVPIHTKSPDTAMGTLHSRGKDIPLDHLLKNYLYVLAQDKRNVVMAGMMFFMVLLLSISLAGRSNHHTTQVESCSVIPSINPDISASSIQSSINVANFVQSADLSITRSTTHATTSQTSVMLGSTATATAAVS